MNGIIESLQTLAVAIDSVTLDPTNARQHPERNLEAVKRSLQRYGQRKPLVVNKHTGHIEAGNATWQAASALGWTEIAVVFVEDDPTTATGYAIADNRTGELARWDDEVLLEQLRELTAVDELAHVGFDAEQIRALETVRPAREPFDLQAELAKIITPRCAVGEVWQLGRHRLACGDATDGRLWDRLMAGQRADLVVTSPPYNVGVRYATHKDRQPREVYFEMLRAVASAVVRHMAPGRFVAWNTGVTRKSWPHWHAVILEEAGLEYVREIVWVKQGIPWPLFPLTVKRATARAYTPNWKHETIYVLEMPGERAAELPLLECPACEGHGRVHGFAGGERHDRIMLLTHGPIELGGRIEPVAKYAHDVWQIAQQMSTVGIPTIGKRETGFTHTNVEGKRDRHAIKAHPAAFPVELPRACLTFLTSEGERVVDPFAGAGATLIAAEEMARIGYGIDLDPVYCELTMRRWEAASGGSAVRADTAEAEPDGRTADEAHA